MSIPLLLGLAAVACGWWAVTLLRHHHDDDFRGDK